ncbi:MAG: hypothetical protein WBG41_01325 [Acidimicrobiales bacterium]
MFGVEEHSRDNNEQAGDSQQGCQSRRWVTYCEGCAHIRVLVGHAYKLTNGLCA